MSTAEQPRDQNSFWKGNAQAASAGSGMCGKGWGRRCAEARMPECRCACGGSNHGCKKLTTSTAAPKQRRRPQPLTQAELAAMTEYWNSTPLFKTIAPGKQDHESN